MAAKDQTWLGTVCKRFSDFAEKVHISVFWAETTENHVRIFLKIFVARYGGKFDFLFLKNKTNYYFVKISSNYIYKYVIRSEIERGIRKLLLF